jgi:hypothetical protein
VIDDQKILDELEHSVTGGCDDDIAALAPGYALWQPGDQPARPVAPPEMFHGPIGEFALAAGEHTEADPVGIMAQAMAMFGVAANRGPHILAGDVPHPAALYVLIIGATAKGAKGTSGAVARKLIGHVDPDLLANRQFGGFGSGEAIIAELAPPTDDENRSRDTRALVFEPEFGGLLNAAGRQNATVSETVRNAWDGARLQNRTRGTGKLVATDYHLGAIGHITAAELGATLTKTDIYGGLLNRWLLFWVERGKLHPDGGNVPPDLYVNYGRRLRANLETSRRVGAVKRTADADDLWRDIYQDLADDDPPGVLGAAISRAAPQCLRLSLTYALADGAEQITADHVGAAFMTWLYCRKTANKIFGDSTGDNDADRLLDALRAAGEAGMDGTAQRDLFSRHPGRADAAREHLEREHLAASIKVPTGGKPKTVTYAIRPAKKRTR